MLAADTEGIVSGSLKLADILFLIAAIVAFIVAFIRLTATPRLLDGALIAGAIGLIALGLFCL